MAVSGERGKGPDRVWSWPFAGFGSGGGLEAVAGGPVAAHVGLRAVRVRAKVALRVCAVVVAVHLPVDAVAARLASGDGGADQGIDALVGEVAESFGEASAP